jgi:hypothetical protein
VAWGGLPLHEADQAIALALQSGDPAAIIAMLEDWL